MIKIVIGIAGAILALFAFFQILKRSNRNITPKLPKSVFSVSTLRYNAYSSAFEGSECTVKATCLKKEKQNDSHILFLADSVRGAFTKPVKCILGNKQYDNYETVMINTEIVITGLISFVNGEVWLRNVSVISL